MGDRLDQAIKYRKTSQRKLGREIKVEPGRISEYKTGKRQPDAATAEKIADALKTPLDYLYGRVSHIELIDLRSDEVALLFEYRSGNHSAFTDAIDKTMANGTISD